jgi:hypothetical protein
MIRFGSGHEGEVEFGSFVHQGQLHDWSVSTRTALAGEDRRIRAGCQAG